MAFGQKDVIASFQTFPYSRYRLPNEAMEVYAADVCRLVQEAFPDFEHNAQNLGKILSINLTLHCWSGLGAPSQVS